MSAVGSGASSLGGFLPVIVKSDQLPLQTEKNEAFYVKGCTFTVH